MTSTVAQRLLLGLFRCFPPRETIFKDPASRAVQEYEAENCGDGFLKSFEPFPDLFEGQDILDLGSGYGGRTVKFLEYGARTVVGLEVSDQMVEFGRQFARDRDVADRVSFLLGTAEEIPAPDASFDVVTMMDVMEHVIDPAKVLAECWRVLRPEGRLATIFPPYYDLTQGSHLHGYATRLPGLNLIFTTKCLRAATRKQVHDQGVEFGRFFRDVPTDKLWNLNGLTVRGWRREVRDSQFVPEWEYYMGHLQYRRFTQSGTLFGRARWSQQLAQRAAEIPIVREVACSRICAVLRK